MSSLSPWSPLGQTPDTPDAVSSAALASQGGGLYLADATPAAP
ncbi:hypothetical protein ACIOD1_33110 [Streptomyces sp. NPDC088097]